MAEAELGEEQKEADLDKMRPQTHRLCTENNERSLKEFSLESS